MLTFLHLSADDRAMLLDMESEGVVVSARELPDSAKVPVSSLVRAVP